MFNLSSLALLAAVFSGFIQSADAVRGRPTLNGKTFVADNGNHLRGPFDSTEWTNAAPEANYAALRDLGFNAVHLYAENFDTTLAAGNRAAQVDLAVQYAGANGLYVILCLANGGKNGDYSLSYAEAFWTFYAPRYASQTHVLYEIQNEPVSWGPPYNSNTANPTGAINLQVQAYNIIRKYAPQTPILFFSYSVLGYGGNAAAILGDIQAVNSQIFGNANAKWTNEAVAFHGYGGVTNTNTVISGLLGYGYPAIMTEFGTVNNAIDTSFVSTLENLGVSWLDFQGIKTSDVSTYVLTSSLYQNVITSANLCWPSDFGTFPCNKGAGTVPTITTTVAKTTTTAAKTTTTTTKASTTTAGSSSCAIKYGQCAGNGWTGATCCEATVYETNEIALLIASDQQLQNNETSSASIRKYISAAQTDPNLNFAAFLAVDSSNSEIEPVALGCVCAQIWTGLPLLPRTSTLCIGTVWGLCFKSRDAAAPLLRHAIAHLKTAGATQILMRNDSCPDILHAMGFTHGNALVARSSDPVEYQTSSLNTDIRVELWDESGDTLAVKNWKKMWCDCGVSEDQLLSNDKCEQVTRSFIDRTRAATPSRGFKTIVALKNNMPVGSLCCQIHNTQAPEPLARKTGTVWAVYVEPEHRRRGIARMLMLELKSYLFGTCGLDRIDLIYASQAGCILYKQLGWKEDDVYSLDRDAIQKFHTLLKPTYGAGFRDELMLQELKKSFHNDAATANHFSDQTLRCLLKTIPQQLAALALHKSEIAGITPYVDAIQQSNGAIDKTWFLRKAPTMGSGFKMNELSNPELMARKFDKLAAKWDDFVTGCRYDRVFSWLCDTIPQKINDSNDHGSSFSVLDLCCGVGFPGQTLRLMGYKGYLIGCDISSGMLEKAITRHCFDELYISDVNKALPVVDASVDIIICTGAMELLKYEKVLELCVRALKKGGELWVSFQTKVNESNPTEHQGIDGVTQEELKSLFAELGLEVISLIQCESAFVTPKDGVLVDIPYLFYRLAYIP
ncbi:hypothetical protein HK100_006433 [Physocladia obscura]|uniref:N-acetyltransferase domain-containing protein n=1 Tax=Physocladia obscura TaxID=109957 RepID=A0AAD5T7R4_9FUNG|nr:hypothetical protein HK100_006433 [Physocladia obscura]